ncbi:MAG: NADH-quinone oxidoreductase subunit M [Thermoproteota archaeon]|jgi:NADH-quinone oxidoreductase subunit M|nr:NADH-quinone oxidoreductase subunit M [Thermoproteota archaeon]
MILIYLIIVPLIFSIISLIFKDKISQLITIISTIITMILSIYIWYNFLINKSILKENYVITGLNSINSSLYLYGDAVSLSLVLLTGIVMFFVALSSLTLIHHSIRTYNFLILVTQIGITGTFLARDFLFFFIFWEVVLIPMFFLIDIWGDERRHYAAMKFLIYTHIGSVIMLLGIFIGYAYAAKSFSFDAYFSNIVMLDTFLKTLIFFAFFIAFAIKMPIPPFHTWLPDAHVEAPSPVSVILASLLLKMGGYGMLRIAYPLVPDIANSYFIYISLLAAISTAYISYVAMTQDDLKRMIAYGSITQMSLVMLAIATSFNQLNTPIANLLYTTAIFIMISHGFIIGALFILSGVIKERTGTRLISKLGGLNSYMPKFSFSLILATLGDIGLPGTSGFIAELLIIVGLIRLITSSMLYLTLTVLVLLALVVTTCYFLQMLKRVSFGRKKEELIISSDASNLEIAAPIGMMIVSIILGIAPIFILLGFT